ncbi:SusC/RagA family TonB-linked outer membrane protein [Niastella yeongjuensis]|uniref:SusC/RagA family TonB-linked outer membrane protein n=1 Tax=Niastella yeongjuensis TaxID=354355 RepID=A0A1V9EHG0_9BACT|nr:TonB-dependent receptor [Niastella yeongjuensis]OQP45580.1 SusC/RagA family TonB-linked outer membrane protein [Niastella yeongjuensis]SEP46888.1 TonB-linked outer membrane protein, SusC/RagA family [Niastella yeongjuensis]
MKKLNRHVLPPPETRLLLSLLFLVFISINSWAQSKPVFAVSGLIKDSAGVAVANATVLEKGTKNAVTTNIDGAFSIKVSSESAVLIISSVGYIDQETPINNQAYHSILLQKLQKDLGEVIVVGYGTTRKASVIGAIAAVTDKDIGMVHGGSTVSTSLAGKLPGVSFRMQDGRPGASANIQVRNMGDVLYVIDGIQQDVGQFNNLAPNDIESITVLKDASAAVYGVRAANGVIVVTTKRGKLGTRNTVNVEAYTGVQNWMRFPEGLTNSYDYMRYRAEGEINRFGSTTITPEELEKYKAGTEPGYQSFNWKDFIIKKNAPQHSVNVNVTGGSDKINYYLSATHLYQNSVLGREFKFNRTNIQSNVSAKIANRLKVGVNVNGRIETRDNPGVPYEDDYWLARFALMRNTPLERPYANDNPNYLNDIKHNETNWAYLNYKWSGKYHSDWRVLQTNFNADYEVPYVKGLTVSGVYSYYLADYYYNNHEYTYVTYTYNPLDDTYKPTGGSTNPWREREQIKQINITQQFKLNYNRTFGLHTIGALFVNERIKNQRLRNRIHSVPSTNALTLIYFNTADTYEDSDDKEARIGYIGRLTYNYDNKYFLEMSARRDASYLFAPENRVGYFPSVFGGWRITEEPFMQKLLGGKNPLTDFKFRGSYGILGDDGKQLGLPAFSYVQGYNYNQGIAILSGVPVVGSRDRGVPITNITWLKSKMTDVGFDFSLWNGKLSGTFDYFYRKRSGLRGRKSDVLVPSEIGYTLPDENINSDAQYGQEGALTYNGSYKKLRFSISGNLSYSRSKFLSSYNPVFFNSLNQYRRSGEHRYTRINWGYDAIGQFTSQDQINNYPVNIDGQGNKTLLPGDLIYRDVNGDNKIDSLDERPIGYGADNNPPNINFGISLTLQYGGFDFRADFSGASGYTWFQNWETRNPFQNDGNLNTIFLDRWHRQDPFNPKSDWIPGKYPALRFNDGDHSNYNKASTFWAHNIKYLRARTLELGYSLPTKLIKQVKMERARFYINAYNLFSFDNVKQYAVDPEVNDDNGLQFPQSKFINVGLNLSF